MKNLKLFERGLLLCAVFPLSGWFFHKPAYYPAQVSMQDGTPCFSVTNRRKERANPPKIQGISFSTDQETMPIWHGSFPPGQSPLRLHPDDCLSYGAGTQLSPKLHQELQPGFRYEVSIYTTSDYDVRHYFSYFCLYETPEGNTGIHRPVWNDEINGRDWRVCEQ